MPKTELEVQEDYWGDAHEGEGERGGKSKGEPSDHAAGLTSVKGRTGERRMG